MRHFKDHLISRSANVKQALEKLNTLAFDAILFVVDEESRLVGSLTDGDIRRGLINNFSADGHIEPFVNPAPKFITKTGYSLDDIIKLKKQGFKIIPVVGENREVVNVINFRFLLSYLPLDAVIMAGGLGSRLRPLTETVPKPLLKVGDKPIIDYNIDRLKKFGIDDFWISVRYLGEQIADYLGDGSDRNINIQYIWETEPLGTIGAIKKVESFNQDYVLITNSDLLTTLNYEDFFLDFVDNVADMSVATIPYLVNVPYAVLETEGKFVKSFKEKPTYTYYSNAGIYIVKKVRQRK